MPHGGEAELVHAIQASAAEFVGPHNSGHRAIEDLVLAHVVLILTHRIGAFDAHARHEVSRRYQHAVMLGLVPPNAFV